MDSPSCQQAEVRGRKGNEVYEILSYLTFNKFAKSWIFILGKLLNKWIFSFQLYPSRFVLETMSFLCPLLLRGKINQQQICIGFHQLDQRNSFFRSKKPITLWHAVLKCSFFLRYLQATKENEQSIVNASFHVTQVNNVVIIFFLRKSPYGPNCDTRWLFGHVILSSYQHLQLLMFATVLKDHSWLQLNVSLLG